MRQRLPDLAAAILKQFADTYHRVPTSQEARELAAQITQDTAYEITYNSVKKWFYRRRESLRLETFAGEQVRNSSHRVSVPGPKAGQTLQKKAAGGGGARRLTAEGVAVLEKFAIDYGRYPTAAEKKELIEQIQKQSGFQITVEYLKWWFWSHRDEYNLKTVVGSRKELLLRDSVASYGTKHGNPKKSGLTIRLPPRPQSSTLHKPHAISVASSTETSTDNAHDHALSSAQVEVLQALQIRSGQVIEESVVAACAASWAVDKHLVEGWLRGDQFDYAPPTPTSPRTVTPASFSTARFDRGTRGRSQLVVPHQSHLSSGDDNADGDGTIVTQFDELSLERWSQGAEIRDVVSMP
ncbi:hypothetical protein FA13DRAFT_1725754 [Coprinellus micaceus]|uniref:Homeobox domain-containing protein n=1 Tax=Coprinellus micaceus TaxID=71717 RepID=A0A4Y7TVA5_COPMI|nr:hypothetical protein FA13DRAFT_1725754 [Coprinellus micaceus]